MYKLILYNESADAAINRRWSKRLTIIDSLPESISKHILRTLDDLIKANTSLAVFDDTPKTNART
jgi:hypothetical protein